MLGGVFAPRGVPPLVDACCDMLDKLHHGGQIHAYALIIVRLCMCGFKLASACVFLCVCVVCTLRCSTSVPERGQFSFLECRPTFAQIGPNLPDLAKFGSNPAESRPTPVEFS